MLQRIEQLEENIRSLQQFKEEHSLESIRRNRFDEWALRYGLFESIQILIDLSCHLVHRYNLGAVKSYGECIRRLVEHGYLEAALGERLTGAVGLRNLLIHEYARIDPEKLYGFLELTGDFTDFIRQITGQGALE
ncbi:type VII toxin-antitoxin system HepT family RNase toxin [Nitratifractor salsuginis]|uniref:DUF86 domain-containing protein n=1 Tax=Nitratifractor salsuginis (strain DSM 16511 / JCM 12458 / E9I37-1) TaxID=749222 RepID=E6X2P6_NITSE|nr:DUF86 domain-containing protein [Nitratifractor salsuginis]ADV46112.1 protein of unknown function DUF86 [Nitratifractor salsuginis DSM 16511]